MQITLHIDDQHAHELVSLLATLLAKPSAVEDTADPAPGHPELSLNDMIAEAQGKADALIERLDAALEPSDPFATDLDDGTPADDGTHRDLPFPDGIVPPPLPEGKTRRIYRGDDFPAGNGISANGRHVLFTDGDGVWHFAAEFSYSVHHIEAI